MTATNPRHRDVFLCGDLHNLGDLKLLLQNLALTRGRGGLVRYWAPLPAAIVRQVEEAGGVLASGKALLRFTRLAFGARLVLGGGQLVRDNVSLPSLMGLLVAVLSARLGGGGLVTRGLGVSAIRSPLRRLLWRAVLARCPLVNVRDEVSASNVRALMPAHRVRVTADMVFLPTGSGPASPTMEEARRCIVISPCIDESEGRSIEGAGLDAAMDAALRLLPDARVVIACHDPREAMDKAAAHRLGAHLSNRAARQGSALRIEILDGYELAALMALYRQATLVMTNRLHALIFAILADAPALAVEDGTAKVRVVADGFALPVLPRDRGQAAAGCVAAAMAFDTAARADVKADLAARARRNLAFVDG